MSQDLKIYLRKMLQKPPTLTPEDLNDALTRIFVKVDNEPVDDEVRQQREIQTAAFLTALRVTELDHSADFVAAAATRIFESSHKIDYSRLNPEGYVDIVGTGGDGHNTFNVSTTSAIIAAGIGINVCKHGGKASTSASGSGDMLKCLDIELFNITHENTPEILADNKFCFLFAPVFHPMMASIAPLRRMIGIPTIFNIMGPLLNPVPLKARIVGVFDERLGQVFAEAILQINRTMGKPDSKALVVWGKEALDEISPAGETRVWHLENQQIKTYTLHPRDFGLETHELSTVKSGTPMENAALVKRMLNNELEDGHPVVDYVLLNTAALAVVDGAARDWKHGVELARESIRSGRAKECLASFVSATKKKLD